MSSQTTKNTFDARRTLITRHGNYIYYRLPQLADDGVAEIDHLPFSIKVVLEGVLRHENGVTVTRNDVLNLAKYDPKKPSRVTIPYLPARVLMQDFTGVPALVDLAALRSAMARAGKDPARINPALPVDLVIDHSVQVDHYASPSALDENARLEFARNRERYEFLHWGQKVFKNFRVVPPASGICHQVNLEYLGKVVRQEMLNGEKVAFPDSLVGTDSHTTMINGLGVLGWGVGGIEAEAVMLGQPYFMMMPEVYGFRLTGRLTKGVTATDLVLAITKIMRDKGVVGKFVEFFGPGLTNITLPDRATIANMAPECGSRCNFFPVDAETINYLSISGRSEEEVDLVDAYCREQGLFRTDTTSDPHFKEVLALDLATVEPAVAGPKRPQDHIVIKKMKAQWHADLIAPVAERGYGLNDLQTRAAATVTYPDGSKGELQNGDVVIAAITSCTNTSNPWVLIGAGLLAKKAVEAGLTVKPYVKTSLAPGSRVVTKYLDDAGLTPYVDKLGFHTVGYGCTTCIGNSGPLDDHIVQAIKDGNLIVASVLSGNRNFEGRINPHTRANYLASPMLVVAYALAGSMHFDLISDSFGDRPTGVPIYLRDLWPTDEEIAALLPHAQKPATFKRIYDTILTGNAVWNAIPSTDEMVYNWNEQSTYIQEPPFFVDLSPDTRPLQSIAGARTLVMVGDSVTTDHISPAGAIPAEMPAGKYLSEHGVQSADFNSFGSRRGNDRVMTRGTFGNIRIRNLLADGKEGGWTTYLPTGETMPIYDAAMQYRQAGIATIVIGGKDYGMGSSRDWAAKGTLLLGVKAVLAQSFETIHRSNLSGMGVLPLQFRHGESAQSLGLSGKETFTIHLPDDLQPGQEVTVEAVDENGESKRLKFICRLDTPVEVDYYRHGGILHLVLRTIMKQ
ncbi:MAG TPA: aconitate hydratase AcnA [bacterium]|nr:aconitate hydratase AcnA [bacterium]